MATFSGKQMEKLREFVSLPTPTGSEEAGMLCLGRHIKEETGVQPWIDVHGNLHAVLDAGATATKSASSCSGSTTTGSCTSRRSAA